MAATITGITICFGVDKRWIEMPLGWIPGGTLRIKRKMRHRDAVRIFFKGDGWIRHFLAQEKDGHLFPVLEQGINKREGK